MNQSFHKFIDVNITIIIQHFSIRSTNTAVRHACYSFSVFQVNQIPYTTFKVYLSFSSVSTSLFTLRFLWEIKFSQVSSDLGHGLFLHNVWQVIRSHLFQPLNQGITNDSLRSAHSGESHVGRIPEPMKNFCCSVSSTLTQANCTEI